MSASDKIPFVGLTGGIGAGKSEALDALARLGAATLSSDAVVHDLLAEEAVRDRLVERFGDAILDDDGRIGRPRLAEVVFPDEDKRQALEQELWPRVGQRIWEWRKEAERGGPRALVVEVPLLFEAGMDQAFDHTIAIVADEDVRRERAEARGHAGLGSRSERQLSQREKAQRADFVVRNDGSVDDLERDLADTLATIGG